MIFLVSLCRVSVLGKKNSTESINHEEDEDEVRRAFAVFAPGIYIFSADTFTSKQVKCCCSGCPSLLALLFFKVRSGDPQGVTREI